jgi:hypothetical protein
MSNNPKNQPAKPSAVERCMTPIALKLEALRKEVEAIAYDNIAGLNDPQAAAKSRLCDELQKVNVAMFAAISAAQKVEDEQIVVGNIVRFREVADEGDEDARFEVVELRGERILLRTLDPYWQGKRLVPTTVVPTADVVKVEG